MLRWHVKHKMKEPEIVCVSTMAAAKVSESQAVSVFENVDRMSKLQDLRQKSTRLTYHTSLSEPFSHAKFFSPG